MSVYLPVWRCGYCGDGGEAVGQPWCDPCGTPMGMAETPENRELAALRAAAKAVALAFDNEDGVITRGQVKALDSLRAAWLSQKPKGR